MIVKGTRRQLIFNSTLKKGNNFTGKEKKSKPEMEIWIPSEDKGYLYFHDLIVSGDESSFYYQRKQFLPLHGASSV